MDFPNIRYNTKLFHDRDSCNRSALHLAVLNGADVSVIEPILQENMLLIGSRDDYYATPLHYASSPAVVSLLLRYGADVKAADNNAYNNEFFLDYLDIVEWNKEQMQPASQLRCTLRGLEPIHYAVARNDVEVVTALLASGASVNSCHNELKMSPLHFAYSPEMLRCLASTKGWEKLDLYAENCCRQNAVHMLVHHPACSTASMETLLHDPTLLGLPRPSASDEIGEDVTGTNAGVGGSGGGGNGHDGEGEDQEQQLAASIAAVRADLLRASDCFKNSPLYYCRTLAAYEALTGALPKEFNIAAVRSSFFHVWAKMSRWGTVDRELIARLVMDGYVLTNFVWRHKYSGRHTTVLNHTRSVALAEALIEHGAMVNYEGMYGSSPNAAGSLQYFNSSTFTPLHSARSVDMARVLLSHGAKLNVVSRVHDGLHVTPVMCIRSTQTVELLLSAGAIIPRLWYIKEGHGTPLTSGSSGCTASRFPDNSGLDGNASTSTSTSNGTDSSKCCAAMETLRSSSPCRAGSRVLHPTTNLLHNGFSMRRLGRYITYKGSKLIRQLVSSTIGEAPSTVQIPPLGMVGVAPPTATTAASDLPSGAAPGPSKNRAYTNSNPLFMSTDSFWAYYTVAKNELVQLLLLIQWFEGRAYGGGDSISVGYTNNVYSSNLDKLVRFLNLSVPTGTGTSHTHSSSYNHCRSRSIPSHVLLLHTAKSARVMEYAINKGYHDVNQREECTGKTALHYATNMEIIKILLHHGADINAVDDCGCTPLHYQDSVDCFIYLVQRGANLYAKCKDNDKMPFDIVCHHYYYGLVQADERFGGANDGSMAGDSSPDTRRRYRHYDNGFTVKDDVDVNLQPLCYQKPGVTISRRTELIRLLLSLYTILERRHEAATVTTTTTRTVAPTLNGDKSFSLPANLLQSIMSQTNWDFLNNITSRPARLPQHPTVWAGVTGGTGVAPSSDTTHMLRMPPERLELFHDLMTCINRQLYMRFVCGHQLDHHWMLFTDDLCPSPSVVSSSGGNMQGEEMFDMRINGAAQNRLSGVYEDSNANRTKEAEFVYSTGNMDAVAHLVFSNESLCDKIMHYYA